MLDRRYVDKLTALAGACCATRRGLWKERSFNENLLGGEDSEYALYLHLKGYDVVYNPKAEVLHEHKAATLKLSLWPEMKWRLVNIPQVIKLFVTGK
jgi:GT2 family glycosyltransferase